LCAGPQSENKCASADCISATIIFNSRLCALKLIYFRLMPDHHFTLLLSIQGYTRFFLLQQSKADYYLNDWHFKCFHNSLTILHNKSVSPQCCQSP